MAETKALTILKLRFGHELGELRDHLLAMNHHPIWIAASNTIDVPAARGFVRSIRGELSAVELRFVAFHETWDGQAQKLIIHYISERCSSASDTEFFVHMDGDILVPRLISTERLPQTAQSVDWDAYWIFEDSVLRLCPLPPVPTSGVLIKVDRTSTPMTTRFRAISGTIVHSGFDGWNSTPDHLYRRGPCKLRSGATLPCCLLPGLCRCPTIVCPSRGPRRYGWDRVTS
jgi:hypothetical protein